MCQYLFFGNFSIPTYGLMMTIGIILCSIFALKKARALGIELEEMIIVIAVTLGVGLFGAGSLYILVTYSITELIDSISKGNFDFLKNSGMVFYGGLIGGIIGSFLALKWRRLDVEKIEQCIVPVVPLGHAFGRIGCLLAGCCHGFKYSGPLAVKSVLASSNDTYFPIQAVEALLNFGVFVFLMLYARKSRPRFRIICVYLIFYSLLRFTLEFFRGDLIRGSFMMLSTSQWISTVLFAISVLSLCFLNQKAKTK